MKSIKRTNMFTKMFFGQTKEMREKITLKKSQKYGMIASEKMRDLMKHDFPFYMIPWQDVVDDHHEMEKVNKKSKMLNEYYLFATFMPPGENKVVVTFKDILDRDSYNFNSFVVPIRKEEIVLHEKRTKKRLTMRTFVKDKSVFADWIEDNEGSLKMSFSLDISHSKLKKFIRNEDELQEICNILFENISRIKEIYTY